MPLVGPSDLMRGKTFDLVLDTQTAMFPLWEGHVSAIGFECQEWEHTRAELGWAQ